MTTAQETFNAYQAAADVAWSMSMRYVRGVASALEVDMARRDEQEAEAAHLAAIAALESTRRYCPCGMAGCSDPAPS